MEDLLREEEFLPKQKAFNPWKGFALFYFLGVLNVCALFGFVKLVEAYTIPNIISQIIAVSTVLATLGMPFLMVFHKKNNILLSKRILILSISLLMSVYGITLIAIAIFEDGFKASTDFKVISIIMSVFLGYGLLSGLIIIPIVNRKQKQINPSSAS